MNIRIEKVVDLTPETFILLSNDRRITEVFLVTEEETDEDFADGTKYVKVDDVAHVNENGSGYPTEDFFLTQDGCEAWRRELER